MIRQPPARPGRGRRAARMYIHKKSETHSCGGLRTREPGLLLHTDRSVGNFCRGGHTHTHSLTFPGERLDACPWSGHYFLCGAQKPRLLHKKIFFTSLLNMQFDFWYSPQIEYILNALCLRSELGGGRWRRRRRRRTVLRTWNWPLTDGGVCRGRGKVVALPAGHVGTGTIHSASARAVDRPYKGKARVLL